MSDSAPIRVSLISLGCPKNLVDSEVMVGRLLRGPFSLQREAAGADVVVVNTCGFIDPAREESIDTICEMLELKARGEVGGVVVAGCMVRRYGADLARELPDVDAFLDISDYRDAPGVFRRIVARGRGASAAAPIVAGGSEKTAESDLARGLLTLPHTAYLRVSEGCDRKCAFCAIPLIRGRQRSKPISVLLEEARRLAASGVRELTLVGEETTAYGSDLGMPYGLGIVKLLSALGEVEGIRWIRLMYAHPGSVRPELIEEMAGNERVAKYLDMPIQHADDDVLKRMKRGTPADRIARTVERLRERIPDVTLRTTILVGFPYETGRRFENLLRFLERERFDRLGCFAWSRERDTAAHGYSSRVPLRVAAERRRRVMTLQREITAEKNRARIGREIAVLVDRIEDGVAFGRGMSDAPEVDGAVRFAADPSLSPGDFVEVRIESTDGYDLEGSLVAAEATA